MEGRFSQGWLLFKEFLKELIQSEYQADVIRSQLVDGEGLNTLFSLMDASGRNYITLENIVSLCEEGGRKIRPAGMVFLQKYLGIEENKIEFQKFEMIMKPKSLKSFRKGLRGKRVTNYFGDLIFHLISSFQKLQRIRINLKSYQTQLRAYFSEHEMFGLRESTQSLTRQKLKLFMLQSGIYSKTNFSFVSSYIIGQKNNDILWEDFLTASSDIQNNRTQRQTLEEDNQNKRQRSQLKFNDQSSKIKYNQYPKIDVVLTDIQNLQKKLSNNLSPRFHNQKESSKIRQKQRNKIGKIIRIKSPQESIMLENQSNIKDIQQKQLDNQESRGNYLDGILGKLGNSRYSNKVGKIYRKDNYQSQYFNHSIDNQDLLLNTVHDKSSRYFESKKEDKYRQFLRQQETFIRDASQQARERVKQIEKRAQSKANLDLLKYNRSILSSDLIFAKLSTPKLGRIGSQDSSYRQQISYNNVSSRYDNYLKNKHF